LCSSGTIADGTSSAMLPPVTPSLRDEDLLAPVEPVGSGSAVLAERHGVVVVPAGVELGAGGVAVPGLEP
jgi:hypothetical protein